MHHIIIMSSIFNQVEYLCSHSHPRDKHSSGYHCTLECGWCTCCCGKRKYLPHMELWDIQERVPVKRRKQCVVAMCYVFIPLSEKCKEQAHVLWRWWRGCGSDFCGCPHQPTCGWRLPTWAAWRHWPPCCRTYSSGVRLNCCHHTPPQSCACTRSSSASRTPGSAGRSARHKFQTRFIL